MKTNAFDWKNNHNEILQSLKKTEQGQKNARSGKSVSIEKKTFFEYSKAKPSKK
jgi:hypothetical protein